MGTTGLKGCLDLQLSLHSVLKAILDLILVECGVGTDCRLKPSVIFIKKKKINK
jgi:hypothetical protein